MGILFAILSSFLLPPSSIFFILFYFYSFMFFLIINRFTDASNVELAVADFNNGIYSKFCLSFCIFIYVFYLFFFFCFILF